MEKEKLIKLAIDVRNNVPSAFAEGNPSDVFRNALLDLTGGKTTIDYKTMRKIKPEFFELVEELISVSVVDTIDKSNPIFNFVETRNGKLGDKPEFRLHKNTVLAVAEITDGTQAVRRQRIFDDEYKTLTPVLHAIKVYEELNRLLSGRSDWAEFVAAVTRSMVLNISQEMAVGFQTAMDSVGSGTGSSSNENGFRETGSLATSTMLNLIQNVEMSNPGATAKIFGTKIALRNLMDSVTAATSGTLVDNDYYNLGYMGKFNGTDVFELKNFLLADGSTKALKDDELYVIATDDKFVKFYTEGDTTIIDGKATDHADLTQDYLVASKWATAVSFANKIGVYHTA